MKPRFRKVGRRVAFNQRAVLAYLKFSMKVIFCELDRVAWTPDERLARTNLELQWQHILPAYIRTVFGATEITSKDHSRILGELATQCNLSVCIRRNFVEIAAPCVG